MFGDSPIILPFAEASDISGFDWKEEMEEDVSSVMEGRKGVLSARLAGGEGPWLWLLLGGEYISTFPFETLAVEVVIVGPGFSRDL